MSDYAGAVSLETPIPPTPAETSWKAAVALGAAEGADRKNLPDLANALAAAGLDRDDVRAGREEVKQ